MPSTLAELGGQTAAALKKPSKTLAVALEFAGKEEKSQGAWSNTQANARSGCSVGSCAGDGWYPRGLVSNAREFVMFGPS